MRIGLQGFFFFSKVKYRVGNIVLPLIEGLISPLSVRETKELITPQSLFGANIYV